MGSAGTRERIIAANKYDPRNSRKALRATRVVTNKRGQVCAYQTFKKKGDLIINGKAIQVPSDGWY